MDLDVLGVSTSPVGHPMVKCWPTACLRIADWRFARCEGASETAKLSLKIDTATDELI